MTVQEYTHEDADSEIISVQFLVHTREDMDNVRFIPMTVSL